MACTDKGAHCLSSLLNRDACLDSLKKATKAVKGLASKRSYMLLKMPLKYRIVEGFSFLLCIQPDQQNLNKSKETNECVYRSSYQRADCSVMGQLVRVLLSKFIVTTVLS